MAHEEEKRCEKERKTGSSRNGVKGLVLCVGGSYRSQSGGNEQSDWVDHRTAATQTGATRNYKNQCCGIVIGLAVLQPCQGAVRDVSSLLQSYTTLLLITLIYSDITSDKLLPDLFLYDRRIRFFQT